MFEADEIRDKVNAAAAETAARQARLSDVCLLTDYAGLVDVLSDGRIIWTRALQRAVDEHEIVRIPASGEKYLIDGPVIIPSNRRIEAHGATIALIEPTDTLLFRNAGAKDGTLAPIPPGTRDDNIAVVGGIWEDWNTARKGYGGSGRFDGSRRARGNFRGVSTLFYFGNVDHLTVRDAVFRHCSAFAVQVGDADAAVFEKIGFDACFADGLHLNGNLSRVLVRDIRGTVRDDLVALNAYDWLSSSVNFGPQRLVYCENLELVGGGYPAIRLQPAVYRYADGTAVDCSISDVVFRHVRGIETFKMYLQTPPYAVGEEPEPAEVGSGGNIHFEDIGIDLTGPIDRIHQYAASEPVRGHFGAFEFGANLSSVHFRDIDIRFHADEWPLSHLAVIGPKSEVCDSDGRTIEIFDPYVSCEVGSLTMDDIRTSGTVPAELIRLTVFDDINRDGRSSGRGVLG